MCVCDTVWFKLPIFSVTVTVNEKYFSVTVHFGLQTDMQPECTINRRTKKFSIALSYNQCTMSTVED